ncbi:MAG: Abi family protein [Verrucomicrobiota bacterium]|jgi:abortive infection bacteriophage resistance protein|nr:Abi family protein [Verrucomicrobiota bacterium]
MSPEKFTKKPLPLEEQLELLRQRGLVVLDESLALRCLAHHNYYRLSVYRIPFSVPEKPDRFKPGTTFNDLWSLYDFDRSLCALVTEATKQIEISARSQWAYRLAHAYGPMAYENQDVFHDNTHHQKCLAELDKALKQSHEAFVAHHKKKYGMEHLPIWAACEVMSFGTLSRFYHNIRRNGDRKCIAGQYRLSAAVFSSVLHHMVYVRNICAHHARLWNRQFTITLTIPHNPDVLAQSVVRSVHQTRCIYNTLVLLAYLMDIIDPCNTWGQRIRQLIQQQKFPVVSHMGFPNDWHQLPIWKKSHNIDIQKLDGTRIEPPQGLDAHSSTPSGDILPAIPT